MPVTLATDVLMYAEGVNGAGRQAEARQLLVSLEADEIIIPVQALAELYTVLTRKAREPEAAARAAVLEWRDAYVTAETSSDVLVDAMNLAVQHSFSLWDAIMMVVAANSGCRTLLSEDMQNGFTWRGVTIRNPFAKARQP